MTDPKSATATVAATYGQQVLLETEDQVLHRAVIRGRKLRPICGDQVALQWQDKQAVVQSILPRTSALLRQDPRQNKRAVAANIEHMLVVATPSPHTSAEQIDRYLAIAELCRIRATIIANKSDLDSYPPWAEMCAEFTQFGYDVVTTSTKADVGLAQLVQTFGSKRSVLAGLSGVGKSSLINTLVPDLEVRTAALSSASGGGRHTTTVSRLYRLPAGGWIIDAPGVRDIRLWPMSAAELAHGFVEFAAFIPQCKFNDCQHQNEPGCAVRAAVENKTLSERRYRSFCDLAVRLNAG